MTDQTSGLPLARRVALVARIEQERGRLDILVNDISGGDRYLEWNKKLWEHDLDGGLRPATEAGYR